MSIQKIRTATVAKYRARKTVLDGITFDSGAESKRYAQLKMYQKAGIIKSIELQPKFLIAESYVRAGRKVPAKHYIADFRVTYADGRQEIEDVKSKATMTPLYRLKRHLAELRHGIEIKEVML